VPERGATKQCYNDSAYWGMVTNQQDISFKQFFSPLTTKKAVLIIAFVGFIVYFNSLFNAFVWDDFGFIINNPDVHRFNIIYLFQENYTNSLGHYKPLLALYNTLLYHAFGSLTFFYHFPQLLLHIICTVLIYLLFRKFLSAGIALFFAVVFLVHPINVESVAYIAAAQSELFLLFGMLALLISTKQGKIRGKDAFLISVLLLFSLLFYEVGFLFLLMVLCIQFLFKRKYFLKIFIAGIASLAIYSFLRFVIGGVFFVKHLTLVPTPIANLSFVERFNNIPAIVLYYLTTIFFPLRLAIDQKWIMKFTMQSFYIPLLLDSMFFIALILGGIILYRKKSEYFSTYVFFFVWFISGLLLFLQLFPLDMTVADRWMYFPLIGLLGIFGVGIQTLLLSVDKTAFPFVKYKKAKLAVALFGVSIVLLLFLRTIVRNSNYQDEMTLLIHDTQIEDNAELEHDLAVEYGTENPQEAFIHLQKSVNLDPFTGNLFHLGGWYESQKNVKKAREYYYKAFYMAKTHYSIVQTHDPRESIENIYTSLAKLLLLNNDYEAAEKISKEGSQYYPNSSILWLELAISGNKLHKNSEAISASQKAYSLSPSETTKNLYLLMQNNKQIQVPIQTIFD